MRAAVSGLFPNGQVLQAPINLGIALNFDRAKRLFLKRSKPNAVYFLRMTSSFHCIT